VGKKEKSKKSKETNYKPNIFTGKLGKAKKLKTKHHYFVRVMKKNKPMRRGKQVPNLEKTKKIKAPERKGGTELKSVFFAMKSIPVIQKGVGVLKKHYTRFQSQKKNWVIKSQLSGGAAGLGRTVGFFVCFCLGGGFGGEKGKKQTQLWKSLHFKRQDQGEAKKTVET